MLTLRNRTVTSKQAVFELYLTIWICRIVVPDVMGVAVCDMICHWFNVFFVCAVTAGIQPVGDTSLSFIMAACEHFSYRFLSPCSIANLHDGGSLKWLSWTRADRLWFRDMRTTPGTYICRPKQVSYPLVQQFPRSEPRSRTCARANWPIVQWRTMLLASVHQALQQMESKSGSSIAEQLTTKCAVTKFTPLLSVSRGHVHIDGVKATKLTIGEIQSHLLYAHQVWDP